MDAERVLVVAGTAVDEGQLARHLDLDRDVELKVIAPIEPDSDLDLVAGDVDDSIAVAEQRAESTAAAAEDVGAEVVEAEAGEPDPLLAIADALATFEADRIVLVPAAGGAGAWSEGGLADDVRDRFDLPVRELEP